MAPTIPAMMRAVVVQEEETVAVENVPVPTLSDNEILVKVEAVAQNPTDWKHVASSTSPPGVISGCDFSGTVVKLGRNIKGKVALGDHVSGFVQGAYLKDRGAFAEYAKAESDLVWVVPKGTLSHREASTMGCTLWTAFQVLYHPTRLALVAPPSKVSSDTWFFIYGGSTSVGLYAIQLAHLSGYKVVTVASPHNHALLKSLGATAVFDYQARDVVAQVRQVTGGTLHLGLDTHCNRVSQLLTVRTFAPGPGKLGVLQPPDYNARRARPDVYFTHELIYTALGRAYNIRGHTVAAVPEDREHIIKWLPKIAALVQAGAVKPNPTKFWPGGLESVVDGFQYMADGKVSGEKIVYKVPK